MRAPREPESHEREERAPYVEHAEQPFVARDLTRWGPIWAGFIAAAAIILLLTTLGTAVGLSAASPGSILTAITAEGIWAGIVMLIGLFIGGWLSARTAAVGGSLLGIVHGSLVWALLVFIGLILSAIGAAAAVGTFIGAAGIIAFGGPTLQGGLSGAAAWAIFAAMIVGLIVAAVGGWIGSRSTYEAPPH